MDFQIIRPWWRQRWQAACQGRGRVRARGGRRKKDKVERYLIWTLHFISKGEGDDCP